MVVKLFFLLLVGTYSAYSFQNVTLELNLLSDPAAYSTELTFSNSRVFTHDVNPDFFVNKVTQGGLMVWRSTEAAHRVTNATLVFNDLGPRFVYLTVYTGDNKSQLLYYLYNFNGWTNLNNVHPMNIVLDNSPYDSKKACCPKESPTKKPKTTDDRETEGKGPCEPVDLDFQMGPYDKFDYRFSYKDSKYTYYYKPRPGYYVKIVSDGKTVLWKVREGQVLAYVNVEKVDGKFSTATVTYIENGIVYVDLFTNKESGWEFTSTTEPVPPENNLPAENKANGSQDLSEALKPVDRLTVFDLASIPEPPTCRKCTFSLNGLVYNVVYFNATTNVRKVVEGSTLVYEVPPNFKFDHACLYVKNDTTVFVDFMLREPDKTVFVYFEKVGNKYKEVPRPEFKEKLNKLIVYPAIIDISDKREGYNVVTHVKGSVEYNVYTPEQGFVVKKVVDGNQYVIVFETDVRVLQVTVHYFKQQKSLMSVFYQNGSLFSYEYFTFFKEMNKWVRTTDQAYFKVINEYVDETPYKLPSFDIGTAKPNSKYVDFQMFTYPTSYVFVPKPGVSLSNVLDSGRLIWKPRHPNEFCTYIWYQFQHSLLYLISNDKTTVRSYKYEKSDDKWYTLSDEEFQLRFNYTHAKLLVADIRNEVPKEFFDVKESDNMYTIKPKSGYLVGRIKYGKRNIWIGSENVKCTSFNLIYAWNDTYLYVELLDSDYNNKIRYYKTIHGDIHKWAACNSFFDDCGFDTTPANNNLPKGSFGVGVRKLMASKNKSLTTPEHFIHPDDRKSLTTPEDFVYPEDPKSLTTPDDFIYPEENKSNTLTTPDDFVYPGDSEKQNKKGSKKSSDDKYSTPGDFLVNKDGDYLVVTEVDKSRETPSPTNLYADGTQVINGIQVKPNSTLHYANGVFDESQYPSSLDYVTGKKKPLDSLKFESRLPVTLEPHNPEKVSEFEENASGRKSFDSEGHPVDNAVQKDISKLNETGSKSDREKTTKFNPKAPKKLVYPKHTDPAGNPYPDKGKKNTSARESQKSSFAAVPGSNASKNQVKENKNKSLTTPEDFDYNKDSKNKNESLTTPDDFIHPDDRKSLTTPEDFVYPEENKSNTFTTPEDFVYPEDPKSLTTPEDFIYPEDRKSLTTPDDFIHPDDRKSLTTPEDFVYPEENKSNTFTTPEDFVYPEDPKSLTTPEDFIYPEDRKSLTTPEDFIHPDDRKSLTTPEDFVYPEENKSNTFTTPDDFVYNKDLKNKNKSLTTPEDFIYPGDQKTGSSDLFKSDHKTQSKSLTTPEDFDYNLYSNVRKDFKESDNGEKSTPSQTQFDKTKPTKEKQFAGFGNGKKSYVNGLLYLQDLRSAEFGEFKDARPYGFNYVLFTPNPGLPIKELRDGFETIWTSSADECLALSVFLNSGFPKMLELFVKCSSEVRRKYYELVGDKWQEVTSQRYDTVTSN